MTASQNAAVQACTAAFSLPDRLRGQRFLSANRCVAMFFVEKVYMAREFIA